MQLKKYFVNSAYAIAVAFSLSQATASYAQPALGGFLENSENSSVRNAMSASTIRSFLPERGVFQFPAPYNTQAVRLTNASDCGARGGDCVNYAGYSYWRNMNNHVGMESMLVFMGLDRTRGGKGPTLFELHKSTGAISNLGPLFPPSNRLSWATGEGWYFSATMPTKMYVNDGPRITRYDVITEQMITVVDITSRFGAGSYVGQMHSSDNDRVHSATVHDGRYRVLGCMAYDEVDKHISFFPITENFDECQVDRSGDWLLIKANLDGKHGEDNLIVNLRTGNERIILDENGAAGHSGMGYGYMIAADNWAAEANTWKIWDFNQQNLTGKVVYHNKDWNIFAPAHLSHTNAQAGVSAQQQYACGSSVNNRNGVHANEIVCFNLDGSTSSLVVAPVMTNLSASGGDGEYGRFAKGNLDVTGQYFLWTSNMGGSRLDAFIVRVPEHLLTGVTNGAAPTSPVPPTIPSVPVPPTPPALPNPLPASPSVPAPSSFAQWKQTKNVTVSRHRLTKTSGCDGCADAGFVSAQGVTGDAHMEFTVRSAGALQFVGFTKSQTIPKAANLLLSLRFQSGIAEVRNSDVYKADTRFKDGDTFSITIKAKRVSYAHNGAIFYSAAYKPTTPLYAAAALYNINAAVEAVSFVQD